MNNDEYRRQLTVKLNALIAVLEIALIKIEKSMSLPDSDGIRLEKIHANLKNTKAICERAKNTLEKDNKQLTKTIPSGAREYIEMSSADEYRKFQNLPPINAKDIATVDLMDLCDKLQAD